MKRIIPILFLLQVFVFSTNVFGVIACADSVHISEDTHGAYLAEAPNDPVRYYVVGVSYYCKGKISEGINHMEKASDMGDITASYVLALYYRSDKTGDVSRKVPEVQENYDATIFYYERTADLIESTSTYPHGVDVDLPDIEGNMYMSIRTFLLLGELYYNGYVRAIMDTLRNNVSYTDTIKVLVNMQSTAERCLNRPSLAVWGERQSEVAHSKQVVCQAQKDFADRAFHLESQRIEVAKHCEVPLSECNEHKAIVNSLVEASQIMASTADSVPAI